MSTRIKRASFIPEDYRPKRYSTWYVYGVRLKHWEDRALWREIDRVTGNEIEEEDEDEGFRKARFNKIMAGVELASRVHDQIRNENGMVGAYHDDVTVRICMDLGIDWEKFPHNTPVLPLDRFVQHAKRKLAGFVLATNETQWTVQSKRIWTLYLDWTRKECRSPQCDEDGHSYCRDCYEDMNLWEIAKQIDEAEEGKRELLASIDAKPRAKSAKTVKDALARIAVRT